MGVTANALLLLSGGIDSTALAYWLRPVATLHVDYGQMSSGAEQRAAATIGRLIDSTHRSVTIDTHSFGSGDLAGRPALSVAPVSEWWPYRNQLLLTVAAMAALTKGIPRVWIGIVASDSRHADGRPDFISAVNSLLSCQEGEVTVVAPAMGMTSAELVRVSGIPRSALAWAHSCHTADFACGVCRGCLKHREVTRDLWGAEEAY